MASLPVILVTCANGSSGKEVVKALSASNKFQVRAGVRDVAKGQEIFKDVPHVSVVNIDDPSSKAFEGIFGLDLIIAEPIPEDKCFDTWFARAKSAGVKHIVFHSSATAHDPKNPVPYNVQLGVYEKEISASGIPYTFLRPTFYHQNTEKFNIPQIKSGKIVGSSHGGRYTVVDVRDIAAAAVKVFENPQTHNGKAYFLTTEAINDFDHTKLLSKYLGRQIEFIDMDREQYKAILTKLGLPQFKIDVVLALDEEKERELAAEVHGDLAQLLGRPGIPFEQYIKEFAANFKP
eukprot:Phypoly_transcript_12783.p1 GENE.Phypoly_transcript_12783~~Phypoly_transcript_12783.p1  ORF type:complete len:291 (+),score=53.82 Phypoly_transcript_12783:224-1096(+)